MILNLILPLEVSDAEGDHGHGTEEPSVDVEAGDDDRKA